MSGTPSRSLYSLKPVGSQQTRRLAVVEQSLHTASGPSQALQGLHKMLVSSQESRDAVIEAQVIPQLLQYLCPVVSHGGRIQRPHGKQIGATAPQTVQQQALSVLSRLLIQQGTVDVRVLDQVSESHAIGTNLSAQDLEHGQHMAHVACVILLVARYSFSNKSVTYASN